MGLFRTLRRGAAIIGLGMAGGMVIVTARHLLDTPQPLQSDLPAEGRIDRKHGGDVYYNVAGPAEAPALVLLHDFYPGASNFEFRRIFPSLTGEHRVYAPDWLGFGMSEHPAIAYTGEFYASSLSGFLRDVVARPAVVVAHGRAANIAVRAASDAPELFERLMLVSPFIDDATHDEPTLPQTLAHTTQRVSLGLVPYAVLSTKPALRWLSTRRSALAAEGVPSDEAIGHLYASAHQFGGQHALLALLTGELDLPIWNTFALLEPPVLLVSGSRDRRHTSTDMEDLAVLNPHADLVVIEDAGDTVYEDQPDAFLDSMVQWLASPQTRHRWDESVLLPPDEPDIANMGQIPQEIAGEQEAASQATNEASAPGDVPEDLTALVTGALINAGDPLGEPDPTGETTAPQLGATESETAPAANAEQEQVGTPGAVVPGVSDAGEEGLATIISGTTTVDESANLPSDAEAPTMAAATGTETASGEDTATLLPEAGEAAPTSAAEQSARAGVEPPLPPATNIAEETSGEASEAPIDRELAGQGDVAGLVEVVQTPEEAVAVPQEAVISAEDAVMTPATETETETAVETPARAPELPEQGDSGTNPAVYSTAEPPLEKPSASGTTAPAGESATVRPASRPDRAAQQARTSAREPGAHTEPNTSTPSTRGRGNSRSGGTRSGARTGTGGSSQGHGTKRGRSGRSTKK